MVIVKIADISEPMAPQEQTKILKNQLVHGSLSLLDDSVKNSDSGSAGWQEGAHNTPLTFPFDDLSLYSCDIPLSTP